MMEMIFSVLQRRNNGNEIGFSYIGQIMEMILGFSTICQMMEMLLAFLI